MSETTEKARALLAAATPGGWRTESHSQFGHCVWATGPTGSMMVAACGFAGFDASNAALIAAAPALISTLCDEADEAENLYRSIKIRLGHTPGDGQLPHAAIDALERRAAESEARADRLCQDRHDLLGVKTTEGLSASEWMMRTATAERERNALRARKWRGCTCCAGHGSFAIDGEPIQCPDCHGSGAVIVEGA